MGQQKKMANRALENGHKAVSFAWIPLKDLELMPEGNRRVRNEALIKEIATEYKPARLGVLTVGPRRDSGKHRIADGQHRYLGLRERGWREEPVPCLVVHGAVTNAEMAEIFLGIQRRVNVKPVDVLLSEIVAEHPDAVAIHKIVNGAGFRIGHTTGTGTISAAVALKRIYKNQGAGALVGALSTATDAWGKIAAAVHGEILEGLALVLGRHSDIDRPVLTKKLRLAAKAGPDTLRAQAKSSREIHGSTSAQNIAALAVVAYNSGRKPENRLPDWWAK
jgi:hypothetical protein